jgi:glutamate-5-semialdehyde dehydrogenase
MNDLQEFVLTKVKNAKQVSADLAVASTEAKNEALHKLAQILWEEREAIFAANQRDVEEARKQGTPESRIDRLLLNEQRLQEMQEGLRQVAALADPVGQVLEEVTRPNGMRIAKRRVPFGVIAMIYESRPNVTVDAAALALKTGNAVVLRGGKEAIHTNRALVKALRQGLEGTELPVEAIQLIERTERESVGILIQAKGLVDLVIPRGGAGLIQRVVREAQVPVIETGVGNCHLYVHQEANLKMATEIAINAKTQRPSVCNAIETLLVDQAIAEQWLPEILSAYREKGVTIIGCEETTRMAPRLVDRQATEEDYATEFLDLDIAVKVVANHEEALGHIAKYSTLHSEAIVTENKEVAEQFLNRVDASAVYHNVSTRFTDGFEFGRGAEIGISTQKLHARGPMGLEEMTSYKYIVTGEGQIRQ